MEKSEEAIKKNIVKAAGSKAIRWLALIAITITFFPALVLYLVATFLAGGASEIIRLQVAIEEALEPNPS